MELRWPLLFAMAGGGSHVIERWRRSLPDPTRPTARRWAFPTRMRRASCTMPSTLFERDKFSGYDRTEGGSRANVGRSLHRYLRRIGARMPCSASRTSSPAELLRLARPCLCGRKSGLETRQVRLCGPCRLHQPVRRIGVGQRTLRRADFELRRAEAKIGYTSTAHRDRQLHLHPGSAALRLHQDRHEVTLGSSLRFHENWRTFRLGDLRFRVGHHRVGLDRLRL